VKHAASRWREGAAKLATALPRGRLHSAVLRWADARPRNETWSVGFSGGADSLALLLLLWAHWPQRRPRLRAMHFNHRLRGAAARADAEFCRRTCRALGLAFTAGAWGDAPKTASEALARNARFAYFGREMRKRRIRVLWLGHHQDDVAETLLMRLARGSGSSGLAAPRPVQAAPAGEFRLRPLLNLKKSEIAAALRAAGLSWREDASNAGSGHFRNRLRRRVVPAWVKAAGRDAVAGAARARELLEEDDRALEARVDRLRPLTRAGRLDLRRLAGEPRAVIRRALYRWILAQRTGGDLSRQGFEALLSAVERGAPVRHSFGAHGFAVIRDDRLRFEPPAANR